MTKLDITYDKSLAQFLTFMHILKENKKFFLATEKQEYTEINSKLSTRHFTSKQILIMYKSYQGVKLQLCYCIWV